MKIFQELDSYWAVQQSDDDEAVTHFLPLLQVGLV